MHFLRFSDLRALGVHYSDQAVGQFPKRIKIGPRRIAWRKADIDQYIAACYDSAIALNPQNCGFIYSPKPALRARRAIGHYNRNGSIPS
jgi:hypothetical protein